MGRRPRVYFPGAIYHALARGVDRRSIFADDLDRTAFLDVLRRVEHESSAEVLAYCLMGNHFHIAIKVGPVPLSVIMQRLLTTYCMRFNNRHGRTGHLFEGRHKAFLCHDGRYLLGLIPYIHMNPVRAGLVSAPQDWPWSSYRSDQAASDVPADFDPWPKIHRGSLWEEHPTADLEVIGSIVASEEGIAVDILRSGSRERRIVAARRSFVLKSTQNGFALKVTANWLKVSPRSISRYARENTVLSAGLTPKTTVSGSL
ncbi:MAG: transposase [Elusimicrobia bacterium]|nr:transposase [Elusimicrobiota bacterium]